jgi:hypothetical protein
LIAIFLSGGQAMSEIKFTDEKAVVERVVPGKLVYVSTSATPSDTYGFKLDQVVIRKADGSCRPYRGEPFADLGLDSGRIVVVWGLQHRDVKPTLVLDADSPREWDSSIAMRRGFVANTGAIVANTGATIISGISSIIRK